MTTSTADVCVIIVNWNGRATLGRCLDALASQTVRPARIIVVDNASTDGSVTGLEQRYPDIEVLRLAENIGFAAANNIAAQRANDVEWLALLNPDAFPASDWLQRLMAAADAHPDYAFFGCRMHRADDPSCLDGTGDVYHVAGAAWRRSFQMAAVEGPTDSGEIFSPCAAAALYRRDAFLRAGGFDKRYFCYFEDVDLGFRLRLLGYRALYVADAVVHHVGSASTGERSHFAVYHIQRNMVWTYMKDMPASLLWIYLPQHLLLNLMAVILLTRHGLAATALKAKWDAIRGLPEVWRSRRNVQVLRQIKNAELLRVIARDWWTPYRRERKGSSRRRE